MDYCKTCLDDAKTVYIYTDGHDWTLTQLAEEFKEVKGCSLGNLKKLSTEEHWPEQRNRYRLELDRKTKEKFLAAASGKKSDQALRNVNRLERLISMLMARFADSDTAIIKSDYDAMRMLRYLMETQTDIYDSIDATTMKGIKGHKFRIILKEHDEPEESPVTEDVAEIG